MLRQIVGAHQGSAVHIPNLHVAIVGADGIEKAAVWCDRNPGQAAREPRLLQRLEKLAGGSPEDIDAAAIAGCDPGGVGRENQLVTLRDAGPNAEARFAGLIHRPEPGRRQDCRCLAGRRKRGQIPDDKLTIAVGGRQPASVRTERQGHDQTGARCRCLKGRPELMGVGVPQQHRARSQGDHRARGIESDLIERSQKFVGVALRVKSAAHGRWNLDVHRRRLLLKGARV